jgi:hypothetical protein
VLHSSAIAHRPQLGAPLPRARAPGGPVPLGWGSLWRRAGTHRRLLGASGCGPLYLYSLVHSLSSALPRGLSTPSVGGAGRNESSHSSAALAHARTHARTHTSTHARARTAHTAHTAHTRTHIQPNATSAQHEGSGRISVCGSAAALALIPCVRRPAARVRAPRAVQQRGAPLPTSAPGLGLTPATSAPGLGLATATSAPGLGLATATSALGLGLATATFAPGLGLATATSAPGLGLATATSAPGLGLATATFAPGLGLATATSAPGLGLATATSAPGRGL